MLILAIVIFLRVFCHCHDIVALLNFILPNETYLCTDILALQTRLSKHVPSAISFFLAIETYIFIQAYSIHLNLFIIFLFEIVVFVVSSQYLLGRRWFVSILIFILPSASGKCEIQELLWLCTKATVLMNTLFIRIFFTEILVDPGIISSFKNNVMPRVLCMTHIHVI